jgi:hypothetical protein
MTYNQVYKHFKRIKAIAEACSTPGQPLDPRNVGNWASRGVPVWAQKRLEEVTNGKLKATAR